MHVEAVLAYSFPLNILLSLIGAAVFHNFRPMRRRLITDNVCVSMCLCVCVCVCVYVSACVCVHPKVHHMTNNNQLYVPPI